MTLLHKKECYEEIMVSKETGEYLLVYLTEKSEMLDEVNPSCHLEVDGGVDLTTGEVCKANGADVLVAGSAFYGAADRPAFVKAIEA